MSQDCSIAPRLTASPSPKGRGRCSRPHRVAGRSGSQPEVDRSGHSAAGIDRFLRPQRQRQEQPGARHPLRRRATPLHRELLRLHAAVLAAAGEAGSRTDRRHSARHRRDRQEHQPIEPIDGRHRHRNERLSAAVVCEDRPYVLPAMRPRSALRESAERGRDARRSAAAHALHDRVRLPRSERWDDRASDSRVARGRFCSGDRRWAVGRSGRNACCKAASGGERGSLRDRRSTHRRQRDR